MIVERNGLKQDSEKWDATQRRAMDRQIQRRQAQARAVFTTRQDGERTTVRRVPLKRSVRVNPVSDKRRVEAAVYRERRIAFLEAHPVCAALPWHELMGVECDGRATTIQHKAGRVGDRYLDESKWCGLSLPCHEWTTTHPALAVQYGLAELRIGAA